MVKNAINKHTAVGYCLLLKAKYITQEMGPNRLPTYICVYVYMYVWMYVRMRVYMYVYSMYVCVYVGIHMSNIDIV